MNEFATATPEEAFYAGWRARKKLDYEIVYGLVSGRIGE
jgi:hypothetical protein